MNRIAQLLVCLSAFWAMLAGFGLTIGVLASQGAAWWAYALVAATFLYAISVARSAYYQGFSDSLMYSAIASIEQEAVERDHELADALGLNGHSFGHKH